jgi:hypothetical protein
MTPATGANGLLRREFKAKKRKKYIKMKSKRTRAILLPVRGQRSVFVPAIGDHF